MSDRSVAHFLHDSKPLEPLVSPPIESPRALSWVPGAEVLLVADAAGNLHQVEPTWGTRVIGRVLSDAAHLSTTKDRIAILNRAGQLQVYVWPDLTMLWERYIGLIAHHGIRFWSGGVAVAGHDGKDHRVYVYDSEGLLRVRARVPERTALGTADDGTLLMARSSLKGLTVVPFPSPLPGGEPTGHRLRFGPGGRVFGCTPDGVTIWSPTGDSSFTIKQLETSNAALHPNQELVAIGTLHGSVAICGATREASQRARPPRVDGHAQAVIALSFSSKGRWLGTVADSVRLWSY